MAPSNINITVSVSAGTVNHGNPGLVCTPPYWYDYVIFFFSNYFAHAATVISTPARHWLGTVEIMVLALVLPVSGITRACSAIRNHAVTEKDPLKKAAKAGALCMVVRNYVTITPPDHEREWWDAHAAELGLPLILNHSRTQVDGEYSLQGGYCLLPLPEGAVLSTPQNEVDSSRLAPSYNFPKLLIGFIQAIWAIVTLYRARGDQVNTYGYAAFGLTVAQYAFMSVLNIFGNLLRPEYHSKFMVRTPLMDEAEKKGCHFSGALTAQLEKGKSLRQVRDDQKTAMNRDLYSGLLLGLIPLAIVGGLSGFRAQRSTAMERGFTISWLVVSIAFGPFARLLQRRSSVYLYLCVLIFGAPTIGGMVVVGRMIGEFGICTRLG